MHSLLRGKKPRALGVTSKLGRTRFKSEKGRLFPRRIAHSSHSNVRRVFFAVRLTPAQQKQVQRHWLNRLSGKRNIKIQHPEKLHITLHFVGNMTPSELNKLIERFQKTILPSAAMIQIGGKKPVGTFQSPNILFARVRDPNSFLKELNKWLYELWPQKRFDYTPHVTLAKEMDSDQLRDLSEKVNRSSLRFDYVPKEIVLVEKYTKNGQSKHRVISRKRF
ncbi:MAG: RNA 2',3'-cyclic phosphodiesterase [Candidatus Diapherotrites archaeon]|nr:RNA 2',3'-cyclic phosphodiesterase [Candidatus Diapherotrites archaeon]